MSFYSHLRDNIKLIKFKSVIHNILQSKSVRIWWRDDDIVEDTKELRRLLDFSEKYNVPACRSVIPKHVSKEAINKIKSIDAISILQHGYAHTNYAKFGDPLNEFGTDRDLEIQIKEIRQGYIKLKDAFNDQFLPIFVPPWNHISSNTIKRLEEVGFIGISLIGKTIFNYNGLRNLSVQIDIHSWETKSENSYSVKVRKFSEIFCDLYRILTEKPTYLEKKIDIGILTHSQIMKDKDWKIFKMLIQFLKDEGVKMMEGRCLINP